MQQYFRETARGMRSYIEKHPELSEGEAAELERKAKAAEILGECEDTDRYNLCDTGAFNSIIKGYVDIAADELEELTDEQKSLLRGKITALLDRVDAREAETYYYNH